MGALAAQTAHAPFGGQVANAPFKEMSKMFVPARKCRKCKEMLENAKKCEKMQENMCVQGNIINCYKTLQTAREMLKR
jgi:hypothetical protein